MNTFQDILANMDPRLFDDQPDELSTPEQLEELDLNIKDYLKYHDVQNGGVCYQEVLDPAIAREMIPPSEFDSTASYQMCYLPDKTILVKVDSGVHTGEKPEDYIHEYLLETSEKVQTYSDMQVTLHNNNFTKSPKPQYDLYPDEKKLPLTKYSIGIILLLLVGIGLIAFCLMFQGGMFTSGI